mgnify:CR=1 FL=1
MIKQKIGKCSECDSSAPEQPLIAGKCQRHYWQFRSKQLKKSEPKEKKPIPRRSKKKIIEDLQYSVLRKEFLEKPENKICKINGMPTTEIHHKYCGKNRAKYYLDTSTWLAVNRDSHNFIHDNPKKSRELGYLM